jgi:tRNA nucleotidyltransferase (CCA-adding enzyme)
MFDPHRGEILDFHGGLRDLQDRRLRHTGAAFIEDPLRVLRAFELEAADKNRK